MELRDCKKVYDHPTFKGYIIKSRTSSTHYMVLDTDDDVDRARFDATTKAAAAVRL
jgi:hypothetical protein